MILIYQSTLPNSIGPFSCILRVRENSPQNLMSSNRNPISLAFGGSCHLCRWSAQSVPRFRKRCHGKVNRTKSLDLVVSNPQKMGGFWGWDGGGHPQRILQHPQVTSVTLDMLPSCCYAANPQGFGPRCARVSPFAWSWNFPIFLMSRESIIFDGRKSHSKKFMFLCFFFDIFSYWGKIRTFMALVSTNIHWDVVCSTVWQMWNNDWLRIPGWVVSSI